MGNAAGDEVVCMLSFLNWVLPTPQEVLGQAQSPIREGTKYGTGTLDSSNRALLPWGVRAGSTLDAEC